MAIKRGIEAGACLWKRVDKRMSTFYNSRTHRHEEREVEYYYVYRLRTRRARTEGITVGNNLAPFFKKLDIRLLQWQPDTPNYTAVGVYIEHIYSKEEFDSIEIDETAQRYYEQVRNRDACLILEIPKEKNPRAVIETLQQDIDDDESEVEEWPEEPNLYRFNGYNIAW